MMVMHPLAVSSASVIAMPLVPLANASNSNTPIGPFQITVQDKTGGVGREGKREGKRMGGRKGGRWRGREIGR